MEHQVCRKQAATALKELVGWLKRRILVFKGRPINLRRFLLSSSSAVATAWTISSGWSPSTRLNGLPRPDPLAPSRAKLEPPCCLHGGRRRLCGTFTHRPGILRQAGRSGELCPEAQSGVRGKTDSNAIPKSAAGREQGAPSDSARKNTRCAGTSRSLPGVFIVPGAGDVAKLYAAVVR